MDGRIWGGGNGLPRKYLRKPIWFVPQDLDTPTAKTRRRLFITPTPHFLWTLPCKLRTMSSTVKSLKVTYNPINEKNTFTSGDCVSGQVTLEVDKDCEIDSLSIKFKGKASVMWTERHGQVTVVYHSKDKYFSNKHYFVREQNSKGEC